MKKVLFLLCIAIASIAMVSCEEPDIEANQVVFDGEVYKVTPKVQYFERGLLSDYHDSVCGFSIAIRYPSQSADISTIEGEYDLTQRMETGGYELYFRVSHYSFDFYNNTGAFEWGGENQFRGFIERINDKGHILYVKSYENESLFKSGTMIVDEEDGKLTLIIKDAELQNGKKLSVWFNIPSQEEQNQNSTAL